LKYPPTRVQYCNGETAFSVKYWRPIRPSGKGVVAACPRRMATRQRPRARRVPAGEPLLRGAAPCACRARRCASPGRLRRSWSRSPDFCRAFWGFGGATEKSARPWRMRARGAAPCRFCALLQQLRAAQRSCAAGKTPQKSAGLRTTTLHSVAYAAGGMRGLCMRACVLVPWKMPFSSTFSAAAGVTELLRGWDVAQRLARLALSNVAERGIGSRGRVGCGAFAM
jgi:hypothetical protein